MVLAVSEHELRSTRQMLAELATDYRGEVPTRIHSGRNGQHYGLGSAPPFAPEFVAYIGKLDCQIPGCRRCKEEYPAYIDDRRTDRDISRTRVTRAFRKLRAVAPLEFDVLYMTVMYRLTITDIAAKLTERSSIKGYDETFTPDDVVLLAVLGVEKVRVWMR